MKKQWKKWAFRIIFTACFFVGLLITFMLNPLLLYANKTVIGRFRIYHNAPLNKRFPSILSQSDHIVRSSELYDPKLAIELCLKDGSDYPALIERALGKDLLSSFYNKIIFTGDTVNFDNNFIGWNGHHWNLVQMLAHAQVHCLEFNWYGLFQANPIGKHPDWKWEGYPEYIARQPKNLQHGIDLLLAAENRNQGWIKLPDGTETITIFQEYLTLVQYCMEVKKMHFEELLADKTPKEMIRRQMIDWYHKNPN